MQPHAIGNLNNFILLLEVVGLKLGCFKLRNFASLLWLVIWKIVFTRFCCLFKCFISDAYCYLNNLGFGYLEYLQTRCVLLSRSIYMACFNLLAISFFYSIDMLSILLFVPYQADPVQRVSGGIILAPEGINGSICGTRESVERVLGFIQSDKRLKGIRQVESPVSPEEEAIHHGHTTSSPLAAGEDAPFRWDHVRVKLKKEVTFMK